MRHSPTHPAPRPLSTPEPAADAHRAGIRSLDCGHDDADDGALIIRRAADQGARDGPPLTGGPTSLGEQQQSV
jgi:hypothetical protein